MGATVTLRANPSVADAVAAFLAAADLAEGSRRVYRGTLEAFAAAVGPACPRPPPAAAGPHPAVGRRLPAHRPGAAELPPRRRAVLRHHRLDTAPAAALRAHPPRRGRRRAAAAGGQEPPPQLAFPGDLHPSRPRGGGAPDRRHRSGPAASLSTQQPASDGRPSSPNPTAAICSTARGTRGSSASGASVRGLCPSIPSHGARCAGCVLACPRRVLVSMSFARRVGRWPAAQLRSPAVHP